MQYLHVPLLIAIWVFIGVAFIKGGFLKSMREDFAPALKRDFGPSVEVYIPDRRRGRTRSIAKGRVRVNA